VYGPSVDSMGSSGNDGKVIHVQFGAPRTRDRRVPAQGDKRPEVGPGAETPGAGGATGKGRRSRGGEATTSGEAPVDVPIEARAGGAVTEPPPAIEPTRDTYTRVEVVKLLGTNASRLRTLEKHGVVVPSVGAGTRRRYTFQDLIALRAALSLLGRGIKMRDVVKAIQALSTAIPSVQKPLTELKVLSDGAQVVVKSSQGTFAPTTGQMLLDFDVRTLRDDVVRVLRPAVRQHRARLAFEVYKRASELDEDPRTMDEAQKLYRQAIELDPLLAIAYTNLGNILFRKGDEAAAEALYSKALAIDPKQPEAKYNLGYLMLERHELDVAIRYFQGAIEADPRFADAYFNLAMAYEELGDKRNARPLWRTYLELEPTGTWADIARQHLG